MARNHIFIDTSVTTATQAQTLKTFSQRLRETYELGLRIRDMMDHMNDGTNFTDIELRYGLAAGQGQTVYNMIKNMVDALEGDIQSNDGKQLSERLV